METTAFYVAIFISILVALVVAFLLTLYFLTNSAKAAEANARARRLTDARMNARLLRLNL